MYSYYNPNPEGKLVGDCVVRAISKALHQDWTQTYIDLTIQGYAMGDLLSSNTVWGEYLKSKGFERDIAELGYNPYVMVYDKPNAPKEIRRLQRWCNNRSIFGACKRFEDYTG